MLSGFLNSCDNKTIRVLFSLWRDGSAHINQDMNRVLNFPQAILKMISSGKIDTHLGI